MKVDSLVELKSALKKNAPYAVLILSPFKEEREAALQILKEPSTKTFYPDRFSLKVFMEEIDNLGFFSKEVSILIDDIQDFEAKEYEIFAKVVEHPRVGVKLLFRGSSLPAHSHLLKVIEKNGIYLKFKEKKKWEREKEEISALCAKAKSAGVILSTDVATQWVKALEGHEEVKEREFEKVLCYLGWKGSITKETLEAVSAVTQDVPIWLLSDAIIAQDLKGATSTLQKLLSEIGSLFPLIAYLRSQFELGLRLTEAYISGGQEKAQRVAPQFKGAILDKKIQSFLNFGSTNLKKSLTALLQAEIRAKSETIDTDLLFEILVAKLCTL